MKPRRQWKQSLLYSISGENYSLLLERNADAYHLIIIQLLPLTITHELRFAADSIELAKEFVESFALENNLI